MRIINPRAVCPHEKVFASPTIQKLKAIAIGGLPRGRLAFEPIFCRSRSMRTIAALGHDPFRPLSLARGEMLDRIGSEVWRAEMAVEPPSCSHF
jgi:hypothetical protein